MFFSKLNRKKLKSILYVTLILLFGTYTTSLASSWQESSLDFDIEYKEILILSSKLDNMLWEDKILKYLIDSFSKDSSVRVHTENLYSQAEDENYMNKEAEYLLLKYGQTKLNLIICLDDESLDFIAKYYDHPLLYNCPITYCGVNDNTKLNKYPYNLFTGVIESLNPRVLVDAIINISPNTTKINIILDNTIASSEVEKLIRDFSPYYSPKIKFKFIKSKYIENISSSLTFTDLNSPSIVVGNFKNYSNVSLSPKDTINILKSTYGGDLYTLNCSYIDNGVIGGLLLTPENHSKIIYEIADRILRGDSTQSITPILDLDNIFIFDLEQLLLKSINRKLLPENVIFINKNWLNGKFSASVVLCLIAVLLISIALLCFFAIQKNKNEKKAKFVKERYDEVVINDKIKTEFIANFSHEIRTLLNVMLSSLQLLDIYKENGKIIFTDEKDAIKLSYVRRNGFRLLRLINNLIDITKLDSGFYHTEFEIKNIVDIIEDITLSVVEYAEAKDINITFDTDEEEIYMPVDTEKIDRIMLNLLSNAIKFTPNNGSIFVKVYSKENMIFISVKDTGVGISKDDQKNIFNRFAQCSNSMKINNTGSGIGLSLVKSLIEVLDGTITINSEINAGSEFLIALPIKDFDSANADAQCHITSKLSNNSDKIKVEFSDLNM